MDRRGLTYAPPEGDSGRGIASEEETPKIRERKTAHLGCIYAELAAVRKYSDFILTGCRYVLEFFDVEREM